MTDIVERLRKASVYEEYKAILSNLGDEAADEIEKLRELPGQWSQAEIALRDAEIYRLRDEIERLRERCDVYKGIARDYKAEIERLRRRLCEIHDLAKCGPVSRPEYMSRMRDIENVSRMGEKS